MITSDDFSKMDFRIGKVVKADNIEGAETLIRLKIDFGTLGEKIILSGIKKWYKPEDLEGNLYVFIFNLEPRRLMGEQSQGMIIAAESEDGESCVLLVPDKNILPGTKVH